MRAKNSGIYMIKNVKNGKFYVGSALDLNVRWQNHISGMRGERHPNLHLQRAWKKYGPEVFKFSVLEYLDDPSKLLEREQYWIDLTDAVGRGYNLCPKAGSALGRKMSEETKRKIAAGNKGKVRDPEHVEKAAAKLRGRKISAETKAKIAQSLSGRSLPREAVERGVETRRRVLQNKIESGEFFSEENKIKRSTSQLNKRLGKNNTSGVKGVRKCNRSIERNPAWTAEIWHEGKKIYVGRFASIDLAVQARNARFAEIQRSLAERQRGLL